jgi:hypothetical protein
MKNEEKRNYLRNSSDEFQANCRCKLGRKWTNSWWRFRLSSDNLILRKEDENRPKKRKMKLG